MLFHFSKACILHYGPMRKLYKNDESINWKWKSQASALLESLNL
jgi:hypothetical protein